MEQQLQAGGVRANDLINNEISALKNGILLLMENFEERTGYYPHIKTKISLSRTLHGGIEVNKQINVKINI